MNKRQIKKHLMKRGIYLVKVHSEEIICPECNKRQTAIVEHSLPWKTYVHRCRRCGYTITESEWAKAPEIKPHEQIRKRLFAITKGRHWRPNWTSLYRVDSWYRFREKPKDMPKIVTFKKSRLTTRKYIIKNCRPWLESLFEF